MLEIPEYAINDCQKIKSAFEKHKVFLTIEKCYEVYNNWSEYKYCSSWNDCIDWWNDNDIIINLIDFVD